MSAGPRIARVHVGGGRTGFSSGVGPFSYYTSTGGRRRSRQGSSGRGGSGQHRGSAGRGSVADPTRAQLAELQRQARRQAAEEAFAALVALEQRLTTLHLEEFPPTVPPPDLGPEPVDRLAVLNALETREQAGLGAFDFRGRREARQRALAALDSAVAAEQAARVAAHQARRAVELEAWQALSENDPGAVLDALEAAFADNESEAVAVNCEPTGDGGALVSLVVLVGTVAGMPDRKPVRTATGAPSTPRRTRKELHDLYARWLASTVLATVKEAFAVAPGVTQAQVLVVRRDPDAADPSGYLTAVYTGRFDRARTARWDWRRLDPVEELLRAPEARLLRKGANREIVALDLRDEPEVAALLDAIRAAYTSGQDLSELVGGQQRDAAQDLIREAGQGAVRDPAADVLPPAVSGSPNVLVRGANAPLPTRTLWVQVFWTAGAGDDLDVSALLCGADGRVVDPEAMVFFNQPSGAGGAVRITGRSRYPDGTWADGVLVDLPRLPAAVARIAVAVSLDGSASPTLAAVTGLRIVASTEDATHAVFPLTDLTTEAAVAAVEIYRRNGDWRLRAVGQGWTDGLAGLARDYGIDVAG